MSRRVPEAARCLNFNGINNYITIPASASLNNLPLTDFSIEFAGKDFYFDNGEYGTIVSKMDSNDIGFRALMYKFNGSNYIGLTVTYDNGNNGEFPSAIIGNTTGFHTYCITWKASTKTFTVFADGVQKITNIYESGTPLIYDTDSGNDLQIGYSVTTTAYPMNGKIGWIRILSGLLHTASFPPPGYLICPETTSSTLLRLALEEGSGSIVTDSSSFSNNGTISGATWETD